MSIEAVCGPLYFRKSSGWVFLLPPRMASSACVLASPISAFLSIDWPRITFYASGKNIQNDRYPFVLKSKHTMMFGQQVVGNEVNYSTKWSFVGGLRPVIEPNRGRNFPWKKSSVTCAAWVPNSQIASNVFTFGTVAVLPFYTSMVIAPRSEFTKKLVSSSTIYIVLGLVYAYLLYLSWTPDTIRLMFASKYWLPELSSISKMFSRQMTLTSAWIHLLVVDLFAARQVYYEGLQDNIETRHSVSLCLMFCPIGILSHFITKALTKSR